MPPAMLDKLTLAQTSHCNGDSRAIASHHQSGKFVRERDCLCLRPVRNGEQPSCESARGRMV